VKTRVQKWGNSLALRIPRSCAAEVQVTQETLVEITVQDGALVVRPILTARARLEDLLAGVTEDNLHREVEYGSTLGNEVW
jgi:antitoxin MazE